MSFKQAEIDKLIELHNEIEGRKKDEFSNPTYLDSPALKNIAEIIASHREYDPDSLCEANTMLRYIAGCYDDMGRPGLSVRYHDKLLHNCAMLGKKYFNSEDRLEQLEEDIADAFWARNYYEPDDCADLFETLSGMIDEFELNELLFEAQESITIKNDPIEKTEKYLSVIDDVEKHIEEQKLCNNCNEIWGLKRHFLEEHGVDWKSPAVLNPDVQFD